MKKRVLYAAFFLTFIAAATCSKTSGWVMEEREWDDTLEAYNYSGFNTAIDIGSDSSMFDKRWVVPMSGYCSLAFKGFDDCNQLVPLSNQVFGPEFTIRDIFLLSKLSDDNKMRIVNVDPLALERPDNSNEEFGSFRTDQYVFSVAPTTLNIKAEQREMVVNFGTTYRFYLNDARDITAIIGANLPIKSKLHILDIKFVGGSLFTGASPDTNTARETTLTQFFGDFNGMEDFFTRAVLEPKCLVCDNRQRKTGIGDLSCFMLLDYANYVKHTDSLQFGFNFVLPTGNKLKGDRVWEIELGNGGAVQLEGFLTAIFNSSSALLNPVFRLVGQVSAPYISKRRVPKLKRQAGRRERIFRNEEVVSPIETFAKFFVDEFEEFDSSVEWFADHAPSTRTRLGSRFLVSVGNYFYNVFNLGFRLGVFYDYSRKKRDEVCVKVTGDNACSTEGVFNTDLLEARSKVHFHRVGWNFTHKFENQIELNVGSQHIIAGRNIPRLHELFASIIAVF